MRLLTAEGQRELDRLAAEAHLPTRVLMENAGAAVAEAACQGDGPDRVVVFCGPGNNGGDGYVAARHLREALSGAPREGEAAVASLSEAAAERVLCVSTVQRDRLRGDALSAAQAWDASGGRTVTLGEFEQDPALGTLLYCGRGDVVVDAVFGCGLTRPPAGSEARAIALLNAARARGARLVAVDIPSGIDSDTGAVYPSHVARADVTVTFHLPKRGLVLYPGASSVGELQVSRIGIPRALEARLTGPVCDVLDLSWARAALAPRSATAYKNDFGHVLALAGSVDKSGAAALLCESALRSGAGLVTLAARRGVLDRVLPQLPEVMGFPLPAPAGEPDAPLSLHDLPALREALRGKTAFAAGPGIARGPETGLLLGELISNLDHSCASVLDADALNAFAQHRERIAEWCNKAAVRPVLTPHPGEFSRLTGEEVEHIEADRLGAAARAAQRFSCVMVLKGARTVVADPDGSTSVCVAGNPGMATAGSGDVLTGITAALVGRRSGHGSTYERARLAVLLHALAGDEAVKETGQEPLLASDLPRHGLPRVFRHLGR
jgi:NAD(P)H-hydrate epimerase